jgi:DNA invertase Pin-like site-specific DNA recombinase
MKHRKRPTNKKALAADSQTRRQVTAPPLRALLYLRCASARQADREQAIAAQHHQCTVRARELGADVVGEFTDFGSGLTMERPGLTHLLHALGRMHTGDDAPTTLVIAYDHFRVARDVRTYADIVRNIERAGASLITAETPLEEYHTILNRKGGHHAR